MNGTPQTLGSKMKSSFLLLCFVVGGVFLFWADAFLKLPGKKTVSAPFEEFLSNSVPLDQEGLADRAATNDFVISEPNGGGSVQVAWGPKRQAWVVARLMREEKIEVHLSYGHGLAGIYVSAEQVREAVEFLKISDSEAKFPKMAIGRLAD